MFNASLEATGRTLDKQWVYSSLDGNSKTTKTTANIETIRILSALSSPRAGTKITILSPQASSLCKTLVNLREPGFLRHLQEAQARQNQYTKSNIDSAIWIYEGELRVSYNGLIYRYMVNEVNYCTHVCRRHRHTYTNTPSKLISSVTLLFSSRVLNPFSSSEYKFCLFFFFFLFVWEKRHHFLLLLRCVIIAT